MYVCTVCLEGIIAFFAQQIVFHEILLCEGVSEAGVVDDAAILCHVWQ